MTHEEHFKRISNKVILVNGYKILKIVCRFTSKKKEKKKFQSLYAVLENLFSLKDKSPPFLFYFIFKYIYNLHRVNNFKSYLQALPLNYK